MTSRIIVKCLPKKISEDKFRAHFAKVGEVTDAKLKFTKDGKFRQFGFVGYKTEEEAQKAVDYFNNTFIDAAKLIVEPCRPLNDENKSRPWSKYSKESSSYQKAHGGAKEPVKAAKNKKEPAGEKKPSVVEKLLGELKDDEQFKEFVAASKAISAKDSIWKDDAAFGADSAELVKKKPEKKAGKKTKAKKEEEEELEFESDGSDDSDEVFDVAKAQAARKARRSDQEETEEDDEEDEEEDEEEEEEEEKPKEQETKPKTETEAAKKTDDDEGDFENGRLYLRNLCYSCKEEDIEKHFAPYGPLVEVSIPIDNFSKKPKGFAYVTCMFPEKALKAFNELDGTIFQGRMLHILPAKSKRGESDEAAANGSFKAKKEAEQKKKAQSSHNWNSLFVSQDAVANLMAARYNVDKSDLFDVHKAGKKGGSVAVKLAVGETQIVNDMKKFLVRNGVKLDAFAGSSEASERSKTVVLVKNLPNGTNEAELREFFERCKVNGGIKRFVMPEYGVAALVEFGERQEARDAFKKLAYRKFKSVPIYLEWAPVDVFDGDPEERARLEKEAETEKNAGAGTGGGKQESTPNQAEEAVDDAEFEDTEPDSTLFVKNLNFDTTEDSLRKMFARIAKCKATIAKKLSPNKEVLSMGYGFVQFKKASEAREALKTLQGHMLDGHNLELKPSNRSTSSVNTRAKTAGAVARGASGKAVPKEKSTKILVRNVPFEAKAKEIEELFRVFGELKYVRLPKKIDGAHRGFGFVEFVTLNDAQRAFEALSHSTHLFGRRLVLEWAEPEQTQDVEILRMKEEQLSGPKAKKLKKSKILEDLGQNDETGGAGGDMDVN